MGLKVATYEVLVHFLKWKVCLFFQLSNSFVWQTFGVLKQVVLAFLQIYQMHIIIQCKSAKNGPGMQNIPKMQRVLFLYILLEALEPHNTHAHARTHNFCQMWRSNLIFFFSHNSASMFFDVCVWKKHALCHVVACKIFKMTYWHDVCPTIIFGTYLKF